MAISRNADSVLKPFKDSNHFRLVAAVVAVTAANNPVAGVFVQTLENGDLRNFIKNGITTIASAIRY